jgi:AcrR family transcriptional regulator
MAEPRTRAAKRAATAQRILEAAQTEFGEHGLEGTTVRAIAQRAGVDPSLVIQHYGSKNDLFAIAAHLHRESTDENVAEHLLDVPRRPTQRAATRNSRLGAVDAHRGRKRQRPCRTFSTSGSPS